MKTPNERTHAKSGRDNDVHLQPYATPALKLYGSVRDLTRNGDGSGGDGGAIAGMTMVSEPALKENVARIGTHPAGFGIYLFDYKSDFRDKFGHGRQFGVMVDEVEQIAPQAVEMGSDGYRRVNYDVLGITRH